MAKYFTLAELTASTTAKKLGITNTPNTLCTKRLNALMSVLDIIRIAWGKPIKINSGYRNAKLNKAVGGVWNSNHLFGYAVDLRTTEGTKVSNKQLFLCIKRLIDSKKIDFDELIDEKNMSWVHFAYRCDSTNRKRITKIV